MAYSSNAILTKARAMYGKRLTEKNYTEMLALTSVPDVANYLYSNTEYRHVLSDLTTGYVKRRLFENALKKHMLMQFESLAHFEKAIGQELYKYFIIRNEIEEIISCIRFLKTPNADEYLMKMPAFLNGLTTIDLFSLAKAQSFDEIVKSLKKTDYEKILSRFSPIGDEVNLLGIEAALIKYLNEQTEGFARKSLSKKEREEFLFMLRAISDLKNISNVYRLKFIFKFSPDEIKKTVLPDVKSNIDEKIIKKIYEAPDEESFLETVYSTCYAHGLKKLSSDFSLENRCDRYLFNIASEKLRFSVYPGVVMFCWIILAENEIKNIIHLTEGIKYGIPPEELKKLIITKDGDK